ncbi:MAG: hypothetical protein QM726_05220 [Chitinophagaceae bacterium]
MKKSIQLFLLLLVVGSAVHAQDTTYKEFVGKYKFPAGSVVEEVIVNLESGALSMNSSAGASALEKIKGDTFNVVAFNGIAVFKRDENKKVIGVHVDASGYVLDGEKEAAKLNSYDAIMEEEKLLKIKQQLQEQILFNNRKLKPNLSLL